MYQITTILGLLFILGLILVNLFLSIFSFRKDPRAKAKRFFAHLWVYANYLYFFALFSRAFLDTVIVENIAWDTTIINKGAPPDITSLLTATPKAFLTYFYTYSHYWITAMIISIIVFILVNDDKRKVR